MIAEINMDVTYKVVIAVIIILVFLIAKGIFDERVYRNRLYNRLKNTWGQPARDEYSHELMEAIKYYYNQNTVKGDIDDITCNDINLDAIYQRINSARTSIGEEYLYALLRRPVADTSELNERERIINVISGNEEERIKLQMALNNMGKLNKISVYEYFERISDMEKESKWYHLLCGMALAVSICLCFFKPASMILIMVAVVIYNVITYYKSKAKLDSYIQIFSFVVRTVMQSRDIANVKIDGIEKYQQQLNECTGKLKKFSKNSWLISGGMMSGDLLDSLMDYIRILFHVDLVKMCHMIDELKKYEKELFEIYNIIGYIDSLVSIASFRAGLDEWCVPVLYNAGCDKRGVSLEFEELYHPLIDEPVKNSVKADRSILLTGSNASGKSTFIKTVAINAVFAQTIHTVLAKKYCSCFYQIYSSMALRDDIFNSESYYIVEIKSLKRIMDNVEHAEIPVLCFIDEVLRGTNTLERIASSSQILKSISKHKAMCFAATHDLELTKILNNYFDNYHFEETVKENNVLFDYKLRSGSTKTRNAIKLLNMIGYSRDITSKAEAAAGRFLENGYWDEA